MTKSEKNFSWPILGHSQIKKYLQKSIESNKIAHAYLFYGPENVGKSEIADIFCMSLLCKSTLNKPCHKCSSCKQYIKGIYPDVIVIDKEEDKQNITINQIRKLQQKLSLKSFLTDYKITIIRNSELMTEQASNALLKTLEEPFSKTIFILLTENKSKLPDTISSRCQIINFNLVPIFQIENWLILQGIAKRDSKLFAHASNGRPKLAKVFIDDKNYTVNQRESIKVLLEIIKNSNVNEKFLLVDKIIPKKTENRIESLIFTLDQWEYFIRDIMLAKNHNINIISNYYFKETISKLAESLKNKNLVTLLENIYKSKKLLLSSVNPKLIFENLSLSF
ncbi:MAG: DNA polymerase III subunit delta' [Candidatus Kerfeldbacteria bacterium]